MIDFTLMIKDRLLHHFPTGLMDVVDESAKHKGHASSGGGGHYHVTLVTDAFESMTKIARHRLIYDLFQEDIPHTIHALRLSLYTPTEYALRPSLKNNGNHIL